MKLKADRATLLKALAHVQSVVERRNTIPILANVMIAVRDGKLSLTATDMEIAVVEDVAASSSRNGACTAPAATLYEIVRKLPDGAEVELDHPGGDAQLALRAGRYATSLVVLPVDDFPSMTAGVLPHRFNLSAQTLRALIDRTRFAVSTEETRYYLNGIYLHAAESEGTKVLRAVATDGHRLARVEEPLPEGAATMPGVIIPRKTVNELRKLLDEVNGNVEIALSDTRIQFRVDQILLTSKLIDGTFPDYSRVIPTGNDKLLRIDPKSFFEGVDRVATIATEKTRAVKMALENDKITLSVTSPDNGTAAEEVPADYGSEGFEIGFNANYLKDILGQIEGDTVELHLADAGAPTLIRQDEKSPALYVLMPMRV
jgi:DNA polymerase-3 subunit beta